MAVILSVGIILCSILFRLGSASEIESRIIGGEESGRYDYPFMCYVKYEDGTNSSLPRSCGSTILNEDWILLAAHCIRDFPNVTYEHYEVACGKWDLSVTEVGEQIREIDGVVVHELFAAGVYPYFLPYDIALIHLADPLDYTIYVQPTVLPSEEDDWYPWLPNGTDWFPNATIVGWGIYTYDENDVGITSDILLTADVPIVSYEICHYLTGDQKPVLLNTICAGNLENGTNVCVGDAGGPLLLDRNGTLIQIGIGSWTYRWTPCGQPNSPTGFVSTQVYLEWIEENMEWDD